MKKHESHEGYDFRKLFESLPNLYLLLSPELIITGGTNSYFTATLTERKEVVGKHLFEVFPDNPDDPSADGVSNLSASLNIVLTQKVPHKMAVQKYDIRRADGTFEERYWSPVNSPVLDENSNVQVIVHHVEDVTELMRARKSMEQSEIAHVKKVKESEDRFHKIFNLSPVAIYMTNAGDGRLLYANHAFEMLFGINAEFAIGKTVVELGITTEQGRNDLISSIMIRGGKILEMETALKTCNGEEKNMLLSTEVLDIDEQRCFIVALVDISERKKMEDHVNRLNAELNQRIEKLRESEEMFQKAFKGSAAGITIIRLHDLVYLDVNDAYCEMTGYSRRELIGHTSGELNIVVAQEKRRDVLERLDKSGSVRHEEISLRHKSGRIIDALFSMDTLLIGGERYVIGISYDITERKKSEAELNALNKELEAFSYSVSHDLRAPLRAIAGFAKILEEDYSSVIDDEGKRLLDRVNVNAEKMGILIDDLLTFSRLGRKELSKTNVNMTPLVKGVINEAEKLANGRVIIKCNELLNANCDAALMKQVMINLIGNAVKYSSKKETPEIEISSRTTENELIYTVRDNGAGFDMRYADKLFGVFQRLHLESEFTGTGVGLAIVQRIVQKHGGRVWAESTVGQGSNFHFSLPVL